MALTKYQREALALIRRRIEFESMSVRFTNAQLLDMQQSATQQGMTNHTPQIKEATRLYRETWIIPMIDDLLSGENPLCSSNAGEAAGALAEWESENYEG